MIYYLVTVEAEIPYWWKRAYRVEASNFGTAVRRGLRKFKGEERIKGKRLNRMRLEIVKLTP